MLGHERQRGQDGEMTGGHKESWGDGYVHYLDCGGFTHVCVYVFIFLSAYIFIDIYIIMYIYISKLIKLYTLEMHSLCQLYHNKAIFNENKPPKRWYFK